MVMVRRGGVILLCRLEYKGGLRGVLGLRDWLNTT